MRQKKRETTGKETLQTIASDIADIIGFDAQFHWLCYKTIGSLLKLCTIEFWSMWEVWRALKKLELPSAIASGNSYASNSCSPNFPHAPELDSAS